MSSSPGYLTISFGAGCEAPSVAGAAADHANAAAPDAVRDAPLPAALAALLSRGAKGGVRDGAEAAVMRRGQSDAGCAISFCYAMNEMHCTVNLKKLESNT